MRSILFALAGLLLVGFLLAPKADAGCFRFGRRAVVVNNVGFGNVGFVPQQQVIVQRAGLFGLRRRVIVNNFGAGAVGFRAPVFVQQPILAIPGRGVSVVAPGVSVGVGRLGVGGCAFGNCQGFFAY